MSNWEAVADRGLWTLSDLRLSNPAKMRKKCCYGQKNLGQYVAVCPRLILTSHTQPTSILSRIKCERYIFIKKRVRSFIEVVIIVDYVSAYIFICMWLYHIFIFGACGRFAPSWRDFEPELNLDDQGSARYQHIKKIRNEKLKWEMKRESETECNTSRTNETRKERRKMER